MRKAASTPGLQAVLLLRAQIALVDRGHRSLARAVSLLNMKLTGAHFGVGCRVGGGLLLPHPHGVIVGQDVVIGENCTLYHDVAIGGRSIVDGKPDDRQPVIGSGVMIGLRASVLGPVRIGDGAIVGAHALVLRSVEPGDVVVGVPARSTRQRDVAAHVADPSPSATASA
ncbi:MAG: serine O-acetyltransferase [Chloroflexota bacterium]